MSGRHVTDEQWADLLEDCAPASVREHAQQCVSCRATLDDVRSGWSWAQTADVPEPSPLYWESFRRSVGERIASESTSAGRSFFPAWRLAWVTAALLVVVSSLFTMRERGALPAPTALAVLPAWVALPDASEDAGVPVLTALDSGGDLASEACEDVSTCLVDLSDEEDEQVTRALRQELKGRSL